MSLTISVPSYVIPGSYLDNLGFLEKHSDQRHVELLFFMYDDDTRRLLGAEARGIEEYSRSFSFTVHMPDTVLAEHEVLVELTAGYASTYIMHPPRNDSGIPAFVSLMDEWRNRYGQKRFLLENTRLAQFYVADRALEDSSMGPPPLCADIGHLRMEGQEPGAWVAERAERIAELHVHGFDGSKDHVPFSAGEDWLGALAPFARSFGGIVEIELFSWPELAEATAILRSAWEER